MILIAHANSYTIKSLVDAVLTVVINPFVIFLSVLAVLLFLWGLIQFMANANSEEGREVGRRHMINGLIGLFIMLSVYGIMKLVTDTFGFKKPDFQNLKSEGTKFQFKEPYQKK